MISIIVTAFFGFSYGLLRYYIFESPFTSPEIRFLGLPNTFSTRYSEDFGCLGIMTPVVKESLANNKFDLCQVPEVAGTRAFVSAEAKGECGAKKKGMYSTSQKIMTGWPFSHLELHTLKFFGHKS